MKQEIEHLEAKLLTKRRVSWRFQFYNTTLHWRLLACLAGKSPIRPFSHCGAGFRTIIPVIS